MIQGRPDSSTSEADPGVNGTRAAPQRLLAGVDEAGRGPLAGPVVAAAVVLPDGVTLAGVRDSKQLSPARREQLAVVIRAAAVDWAIAEASREEIDRLNILHASLLAMARAVAALRVRPDAVEVDGNRAPELPGYAGRIITVVGGDRLRPAISAASILAKVHRDHLLDSLHQRYPDYGFDRHKGYPTPTHLAALADHGPCPEHRLSFAPVRRALGQA
jgi:ribonuclease HII